MTTSEMSYGHPLRFGIRLRGAAGPDPGAAARTALLAEELGYDLVSVADRPELADLDGLTLLSWIAAGTATIKLRAEILSSPLREPALLARTIAGLDRLAGGRTQLVLGAGEDPASIVAAGGPDRRGADAIAALEESIDVINELWNVLDRGLARLDGRFHRLDGARKAGPAGEVPIGVSGDDDMSLELAGRRSDAWSSVYRDAGALARANVVIDAAARASGRDPREIRRSITIPGGSAAFIGSAADRVDELMPLIVEHGVGTIVIDTDDADLIAEFARDVIPALRAAADEVRPRGSSGSPVRNAAAHARRHPGFDYADLPRGLAEIVEPGDRTYARLRSGYLRGGNPAVVLRAATADQVAEAVRYAARHPELPLSRRSAGHGISGRSTNDGGIVIDVSLMNSIEVLDEETRRVRIGPGARWMDVAAALHPYGWALSSGDYGGVGVGGLATAGGIGYLVRAHGLTIDHLRAVRMVLADGSILDADEVENPDLFWAVRGAGANFGIVTSFEFEADEVGPVGYAELTHDATDTARFLADWGRAVENAPRDVTSFLIVPPPRAGRPAFALSRTMVDSADPDTVLARLRPFADIAALYAQQAQITPYAAVMANADDEPPQSSGEPVSRSGLLDHITPRFAAAAARAIRSGGIHWFQIRSVGGAVADVDADATAYANRAANFSVVAMGSRDDVVDALWATLLPFFEGSYLSFDSSLRPERLTEAWPARTLARLQDLKAKYDPAGVFHDNFAITGPERTDHA